MLTRGRYRAARAANYIFNKDDICKELCAALYTLEEVMSQLRIKSGRSGRYVRQVGQVGRSGR